VDPVLHLSIVVDDLATARPFYVDTLGCRPGRERAGWMDVWFFGLQLTLQERPDLVLAPDARGPRHFGVALDAATFADVVGRVEAGPHTVWVSPVTTDGAGTPRQQTKCKVADPAGNVIELKTYADPVSAFAD
jgi:extradiol dioxygenase family protein